MYVISNNERNTKMDDRGEKIVNMARAMLQQPDTAIAHAAMTAHHHRYSWKAVALAAMLAAAGTGATISWVAEQRRPLNHYEKVELIALLHYAAISAQHNEQSLREDLCNLFAIDKIDELSQSQFNEAKQYLQNKIRNKG
jgi:hypothetical protein